MSKKGKKLAAASALAAGLGAMYYASKKKENGSDKSADNGYRNTERGKYEKNSKGIYYSNVRKNRKASMTSMPRS